MKIHLLIRKEDLDPTRITDKVAVVFDVLFATSTLVTVLAEGAHGAYPVVGAAAAMKLAERLPDAIVSGEWRADTLPGFADPTPLALINAGVRQRPLIYATTNGTVALDSAAAAASTYAAALVNAKAMARHLLQRHANDSVLLICAGSSGAMNLEDMLGAGACLSRLVDGARKTKTPLALSDAAKTALLTYLGATEGGDMETALLGTAIGQLMHRRGLKAEIRAAADEDRYNGVAKLADGCLRWQGV